MLDRRIESFEGVAGTIEHEWLGFDFQCLGLDGERWVIEATR